MVRTRFQSLMKQVGRPGEPDAELLRRYTADRDEAAFTELVRRYGRFVWGQCRSLLPAEADADDAFQATFLALAKSSKAIRSADRLGPWLHGVAYRVCQNAKRLAARRKKRERAAAAGEASRPVADSNWDSAVAAVHDELHQLSETLRVPFILCCLEGKGTTEAADQLGMKLGTFSARLTRAKQTLIDRLSARGITAGVVALTAMVGGATGAPSQMIDRAVGLATSVGSVPANILSLTHGVLGMGTFNGKLLAAAVMMTCGLAAGFGGAFSLNAQEPGKKEVQDARDKELQELKRVVEQQRSLMEQQRSRAEKDIQAERNARAKEDGIRAQNKLLEARAADEGKTKRLAEEKVKSPEFKYFGQSPDFAPTAEELESLVKRGEEGGYKFVGITNMRGTSKQGNAAVPTLVFRRDGLVAKVELLEKSTKAQAESALDKVKEKLAEVNSDKVREATKRAEAEVAEVKKKVEAKIKEAQEKATKATEKTKGKEEPGKPAQTDERAKTQTEIDELRAKIAELEGKGGRKAAQATAKFAAADLGKGNAEAHVKLLTELANRKFPNARIKIRHDAKSETVVVEGDPEVVKWMQEAVKLLAAPDKTK